MNASDIAQMLAERIDSLVEDLLPAGHREGRHEWRCGSVSGAPGHSLGVHLSGHKRGVWADFANPEHAGDPLDLVKAVLNLDTIEALRWSRRWLGIEDGETAISRRRLPNAMRVDDPERWRRPWRTAQPIAGTLAEIYLAARLLAFDDPDGRVLRFHPRRVRKNLSGKFESHPALLAALNDVKSGEQYGIINIFLQVDGRDRIRDQKGKTTTGRALGTAVMLSGFDEPTTGLTICEGIETGIAILMTNLSPVWALGGAGNLGSFPVLDGIECLSIAADTDKVGQDNAEKTAERWGQAGRAVLIATPPSDDWAAAGDRR
jgi:Toprim domain-containing protein